MKIWESDFFRIRKIFARGRMERKKWENFGQEGKRHLGTRMNEILLWEKLLFSFFFFWPSEIIQSSCHLFLLICNNFYLSLSFSLFFCLSLTLSASVRFKILVNEFKRNDNFFFLVFFFTFVREKFHAFIELFYRNRGRFFLLLFFFCF